MFTKNETRPLGLGFAGAFGLDNTQLNETATRQWVVDP